MVVYSLSKCYILRGKFLKFNKAISSVDPNQTGNLFQLGMILKNCLYKGEDKKILK